jgi:predicted phosphoribosyltransferase
MFKNRIDAARKLLPYLGKYRKEKGVVLALPKGSVPMAYLIARHLGFPLDLMMTKKIGYPGSPEFAIGSVSLIGRILDPEKDIDPQYINEETTRIRKLLQEQSNRFIGNKKPVPLQGKTVILIDDGIATGYTMLEAIQLVRDQNPKKIVVAVPVASPEAVAFFKPRVDEIICLYQPKDFKAVGQFYEDFPQVTDEEVIHCMQDSQNLL